MQDNRFGNNHNERYGYSSSCGPLLENPPGNRPAMENVARIQNRLKGDSCSGVDTISDHLKAYGTPLGNIYMVEMILMADSILVPPNECIDKLQRSRRSDTKNNDVEVIY